MRFTQILALAALLTFTAAAPVSNAEAEINSPEERFIYPIGSGYRVGREAAPAPEAKAEAEAEAKADPEEDIIYCIGCGYRGGKD